MLLSHRHGSSFAGPPAESNQRLIPVQWAKGNKITRVVNSHSFRVPLAKLANISDLEAQSELIVIARPIENLAERKQLLLYFDNEQYPHLGASIAQVEVLHYIKKPSGLAVPPGSTLPISESLFVYPNPEAGPGGLVLRRMASEYRELKKGNVYLLFLATKPEDDITTGAGVLYSFVAASLGKYNLNGLDPQDDAELEHAYESRNKLPVAQQRLWKAPVTQKQ